MPDSDYSRSDAVIGVFLFSWNTGLQVVAFYIAKARGHRNRLARAYFHRGGCTAEHGTIRPDPRAACLTTEHYSQHPGISIYAKYGRRRQRYPAQYICGVRDCLRHYFADFRRFHDAELRPAAECRRSEERRV